MSISFLSTDFERNENNDQVLCNIASDAHSVRTQEVGL